MIPEKLLQHICGPIVLNRARAIQARGMVQARKALLGQPSAPGGLCLSAQVRSSSDAQHSYESQLCTDAATGEILSYSCSCQATGQQARSCCKHVAAVALDFNKFPQLYDGYAPQQESKSTPGLRQYLDMQESAQSDHGEGASAPPQLAKLHMTLLHTHGRWTARFSIDGGKGRAYVLKNLSGLCAAVATQSYASYGKSLAFVHRWDAFDRQSQKILTCLMRAVAARSMTAELRNPAAPALYTGQVQLGRDLDLTPIELEELLELHRGQRFLFDPGNQYLEEPREIELADADPGLALSLKEDEEGGYTLSCTPGLSFITGMHRLYIWDGQRLFRCSDALSRHKAVLHSLFSAGVSTVQVAASDAGRFARYGLPALASLLDTPAPQSLEALRPDEAQLSFYFDKNSSGIVCTAQISYRGCHFNLLSGMAQHPVPGGAGVEDGTAHLERNAQAPGCPGHLSGLAFEYDNSKEQEARALIALYFPAPEEEVRELSYAAMLQLRKEAQKATSDATSAPAPAPAVASGQRSESDAAEGVGRAAGPAAGEALLPAGSDQQLVARLLFEGLPAFAALGPVYTTPAFDRLISQRRPSLRAEVSMGSDLIRLDITADDLPQDEAFALLRSYREKKQYHRLRDGSFLALGGLDLDTPSRLVDGMDLTSQDLAQGQAQLPLWRAFTLDRLADGATQDASFKSYLEHIRSLGTQSCPVPVQLQQILRPYQVAGYQWLSRLVDMGFGGILADEMGLGKTLQLIALLLARRSEARQLGPSLVVCPASLVFNWTSEFSHFAPELDVAAVVGSPEERQCIREEANHDVLVTSYELLRRDSAAYAGMQFWCEVLDEAQSIKNHSTLSAICVKKIQARHRFALTGTPVENRLSELWSIFDFVMPGLLSTYSRFRARYEEPIASGGKDAEEQLHRAVAPFILRRLKSEVLTELPPKHVMVVKTRLEGEQKQLYRAYEQQLCAAIRKEHTQAQSVQGSFEVLAGLMRLRQLCCDPRLVYEDYTGPSAKLDTIMDLVQQAISAQHKILLFSQFTSYLDLIAARLADLGLEYYRIDGSTPTQARVQYVDAFNSNSVPVFLISLKAGGAGLNLTGAQVVIHADPWWNEAAQNQATDRAHRIGQTRTVSVYKVLVSNSIEERIEKLQQAKSGLAGKIVDAAGLSLADLSADELIDLLSGTA